MYIWQDSEDPIISQRTKDLIHRLLQGKFSLADIAKIIGVSEQWLYSYLNQAIEKQKERNSNSSLQPK